MPYDLLCMGRSSIDLYSNDIGSTFARIGSFAAYVGGSPTNVAVGARRLGLRTALLTAVGADPVGDFILDFLQREGVETRFIPRKEGRPSSAVVLGVEPPDRFPLVFYRNGCADVELTIDDAQAAPLEECAVFEFVGTNLSLEPSRSATLWAAERTVAAGARVVFDLDFRPGAWHDARAFGIAVRSALRLVHVVLGTEDELRAACLRQTGGVTLNYSQQSDARVAGEVESAIAEVLALGPEAVILKVGAEGSRIYLRSGEIWPVAGFPVRVVNILGAGDAFAAGFVHGLVRGWDWRRSARLGNACGAHMVTQHGCANFMATMAEAERVMGEPA